MSDEIIVTDALNKLKEEIQLLKITLSNLLQQRDDLTYHICPELRAKYAKEIGDYQNKANSLEIVMLELKRKIEITRAALNREKTVSEQEVNDQVKQEYQQFHQKVDEEYRKSKEFQEEQERKEEKRRHYEEQWQSKYGDGDEAKQDSDDDGSDSRESNANTSEECHRDKSDEQASDAESNGEESGDTDTEDNASGHKARKSAPLTAKELYRKIVKRLHPDMNPDATEHEMELFRKATKAYEEGDILTLQEIYDEIFGFESEKESHEETMEELTALKDRLLKQISRVTKEIDRIKSEFPYTEKELLDNPAALKAKQDAILQHIKECEAEIVRLNEILQEVNQEMEELLKRKKK